MTTLPYVNRSTVLQRLLDLHDAPAYLEIGLDEGKTFRRVRAARKVGVDPDLRLDPRHPDFADGEFHAVTSDEYFALVATDRDRFDVIFLDGLHTAEQTLRDLMNALPHRTPRGVIVLDDVRPSSYHASLPDEARAATVRATVPGSAPDWMGDVYKLVFFVESFLPAFDYATVDNNHGQLVLWPERRADPPTRTLGEIDRLQYADVIDSAAAFRAASLDDIAERVRAALARVAA